jgi:hypothetical protein
MSAPLTIPDVRKRPRRWRRWLKWLALVLVLIVGEESIRRWYTHRKVTGALEAALAELDEADPGWRLEQIEAAREIIPEAENSARVVMAVAAVLPDKWPPEDCEEAIQSGEPPCQLDKNRFDRLSRELDDFRPALLQAHKLAGMPRGRHRIVYAQNVLDTLLEDQVRMRHVALLLREDAARQAQLGDLARALRSCRAALNAARSIGDEPVAISQMFRAAECGKAQRTLEWCLAQGEAKAEELEAIGRLLRDEDMHDSMRISTRADRAMGHAVFAALEDCVVSVDGLSDGSKPPGWTERLTGFAMRDEIRRQHPLFLSLTTRRLAETERPIHEQGALEHAFMAEVHSLSYEHAAVVRLIIVRADKLGDAFRRKHALARCGVALLAVERHRLATGSWPETLQALVPRYLTAVPRDPFDGQPIRYRRLPDGVVVYSVGHDETDDGGTIDRKNPTRPGTDLGFRLWDVAHRAQPARPRAPPPDQ